MEILKIADGATIAVVLPWEEGYLEKIHSMLKKYKMDFWYATNKAESEDYAKKHFKYSSSQDYDYATGKNIELQKEMCFGFLIDTKEILKEIMQ